MAADNGVAEKLWSGQCHCLFSDSKPSRLWRRTICDRNWWEVSQRILPCQIYSSSLMTSMPTSRPWSPNGLKTVRKCQNLRQSGKTFSTKLDCPSLGVFTNLVAVPARCAARSHQDRVLLEAWLDPTCQPV